MDFRSPDPIQVPRDLGPPTAPVELIEAVRGARELFATRAEGAWELYRDGMMIGRVSRPAPVPLAQVLSPRATVFDPTRRL